MLRCSPCRRCGAIQRSTASRAISWRNAIACPLATSIPALRPAATVSAQSPQTASSSQDSAAGGRQATTSKTSWLPVPRWATRASTASRTVAGTALSPASMTSVT